MIRLKTLLTEVKAPEVLQASMLNITAADLQPFVDRYNAAFKAAAQAQKKLDPEFPVVDQYVKLRVETKIDPNGREVKNYEVVPGGNGSNWDMFRKFESVGMGAPFNPGSYSFIQYKDSKPNDPENVKITNGTWNLSRHFNKNGEFKQGTYDKWITGNGPRVDLKTIFANDIATIVAQRVAALIIATKGAPYDNAFKSDGTLKVTKANEVLPAAGSAVKRTGQSIAADIDKMIDKKYAQFNSVIMSQLGR